MPCAVRCGALVGRLPPACKQAYKFPDFLEASLCVITAQLMSHRKRRRRSIAAFRPARVHACTPLSAWQQREGCNTIPYPLHTRYV